MSRYKFSTADWRDEWDAAHPVVVTFGDGKESFLSVDAAVARLADEYGADVARDLLGQGKTLTRFNASQYVVRQAPLHKISDKVGLAVHLVEAHGHLRASPQVRRSELDTAHAEAHGVDGFGYWKGDAWKVVTSTAVEAVKP